MYDTISRRKLQAAIINLDMSKKFVTFSNYDSQFVIQFVVEKNQMQGNDMRIETR